MLLGPESHWLGVDIPDVKHKVGMRQTARLQMKSGSEKLLVIQMFHRECAVFFSGQCQTVPLLD